MAAKNRELDTEINLVAFISLLSVLICSLLLTAIWVQIGSMNVKQAVGGQSSESSKKIPTLWVTIAKNKDLKIQLEDGPRGTSKLRRARISALEGEVDLQALDEHVVKLTQKIPELRTALIKPVASTLYDDIINVMDHFKKAGLVDLGVSPL